MFDLEAVPHSLDQTIGPNGFKNCLVQRQFIYPLINIVFIDYFGDNYNG